MKKIVIVILLMLVGTVICFAQPKTKTFSKDGISFEYEKDWTVQSFGGLIVAVCKGNTFSINKITNNSDEEIFEAYLQSTYKIKEEEVGSDYITKIIDRTLNGIE
ncbi:MAG: hypothetical protein FWC41_12610, partial [Firmicutes bacterium]|nr:hypothetical protein [Bacillota bacterium]